MSGVKQALMVSFVLGTLLSSCGEGESYRVLEDESQSESGAAMRRVRSRQMLRYRSGSSVDTLEIPFSWSEFVNGTTWSEVPPQLNGWLENECGQVTQCRYSFGARACDAFACMTSRVACQANVLLEVASAVDDVYLESSDVHIPIQSREVRAALSETAVRLIASSIFNFEASVSWLDDYECVADPSRLSPVVLGLRDVHDIGREASERAVADYLALADRLAATDLGPRGVVEVRLHAARFLIGRGGSAIPQGLGVCTSAPLSPQSQRALAIIRESGVAPTTVDSAVGTREFLEQSVIPRLYSLSGHWGATTATEFLHDRALDLDDFDNARRYLREEYEAFSRDASVVDSQGRHAATVTRPTAPPAIWYAGRARALGLPLDVEFGDPGAPFLLPETGEAVLPTMADLAHALRQVASEFRATANSLTGASASAFEGAAVQLEQAAHVDHEGWLYTGHLIGDLSRTRAAVLSRHSPADLIIVKSATDLRCAVTGEVEGQPCRWTDMTVYQASGSSSERAAWQSALNEELSRNGRVSNDPSLQMSVFSDIGGRAESVFLLKRRSGGTARQVGGYEPLAAGSAHRLLFLGEAQPLIQRFHIAPGLHTWAGELLMPSPDFCGRPRTSCAGVTTDGRIPLEDDLTDDGDAYESSWRRYLSLAETAAREADRLADEAIGVDLEIATRSEQAAQELEDLCGDGVEFEAIATLAQQYPERSILELIESLPEGEGRRVLERCMGEEAVLPYATLGNRDLCLWAPTDDPSDLCGYQGNPPDDLECPRWATSEDAPCRVPPATAGRSYQAIRIADASLLGIVEASTPATRNIPEPNLCSDYREFRHHFVRGEWAEAGVLHEQLFQSSGVFNAQNVASLAHPIKWTAEPGSFARLEIGGRLVVDTGSFAVGPSSEGLCSPVADEGLRTASGCLVGDHDSLLCSNYNCMDESSRRELNIRVMQAAMVARWLGARSLEGFTQIKCAETVNGRRYSATESYEGELVGFYTRSDSKPGVYYCDPDASDGVFDPWGITCDMDCGGDADGRRDTRHGVRFVEMKGKRVYGNRAVDGNERSLTDVDSVRVLQRLRSESPTWDSVWNDIGFGTGVQVTNELPWFLADEQDCSDDEGPYCGLSAFLPNTRRTIQGRAVLDALELLCMSAVGEDPNGALSLPTTIAVDDIDSVADNITRYAAGITDQASLMVLRNVPVAFADEFRGGQVGTVPSAYGGDISDVASRAREALLKLRSAPESIQEEIDGLGRDIVRIKNEIVRLGYEEELVATGLLRDVATSLIRCLSAIAQSTNIKSGVAGGVCAASAFEIAAIIQESEIRKQILESRVETALNEYVDGLAERSSSIRLAGDALLAAQNSVNAAFEEMASKRREARRSMARALHIADPDTGVLFESSATWRTRLSSVRQRYERARRDAILMAWLAKRSIEARLGVDLASIVDEMALVEAPAAWESDVCGLDAFDAGESTDEVRSRYIGEYVAKLASFIDSYRIDFPYIDGRDVAVVSMRDDIFRTRAECAAPSINLLEMSDELSGGSWATVGCGGASVGGLWGCVTPVPTSSKFVREYWEPDYGQFQTYEMRFDDNWQSGSGLRQQVSLVAGTYVVSGVVGYEGYPVWNGDGDAYNQEFAASVRRALDRVEVRVDGALLPVSMGDGDYSGFQGDFRIVRDADGQDWIRFARRVSLPIDGELEIRIVRGDEENGGVTRVGGLSVVAEVDHGDVSIPRFVRTDENAMSIQYVCEDTDGDVFREVAWNRGCMRLCPDGFSQACGDREAREYCFWETEFAISQQAIDSGNLFAAGGFARGNFNYRVDEVGLNFVGTELRQCDSVSSAGPCYGSGFWTYSLEHVGPYLVRDYRGGDYEAPLFTGRIEHARGLAAERYLTNPASSADRSLMQDYMHRQLRGRPLSGLYRLRVWDDAGVAFDRLEDIQLVLGYRYWTRTR